MVIRNTSIYLVMYFSIFYYLSLNFIKSIDRFIVDKLKKMENYSDINFPDVEQMANQLLFDLNDTIVSPPEPFVRTRLNNMEYTDKSYETSINSPLNSIFELAEFNNETSNIKHFKHKKHYFGKYFLRR